MVRSDLEVGQFYFVDPVANSDMPVLRVLDVIGDDLVEVQWLSFKVAPVRYALNDSHLKSWTKLTKLHRLLWGYE